MTAQPGRLQEALVAGGLAAVAAAAAVFGMLSITKPGHFDARVADLQGKVDSARRMMPAVATRAFAPTALCSAAPQAAADKLSADLKTAAHSLQLNNVDVQVSPQREVDGGLVPLTVRFNASGQYTAMLAVLQKLSGLRPVLFVDTVDLTSKTSFVTFSLSGRVLCSAPR
jgi:hypothetical protein